jgi:hypothetical protein
MLNALVWTAGLEVPTEGFVSAVTPEDMAANMDEKAPRPAAPKPAEPAKQPAAAAPAPAKI